MFEFFIIIAVHRCSILLLIFNIVMSNPFISAFHNGKWKRRSDKRRGKKIIFEIKRRLLSTEPITTIGHNSRNSHSSNNNGIKVSERTYMCAFYANRWRSKRLRRQMIFLFDSFHFRSFEQFITIFWWSYTRTSSYLINCSFIHPIKKTKSMDDLYVGPIMMQCCNRILE